CPALPLSLVPPVRARRGPLRRDPPRNAGPRGLGRPVTPGRTLPRQTAAAVLAGHGQLPRLRHRRLVRPPRPRPAGPRGGAGDLPAGPTHLRRPRRLLGGAAAPFGAGFPEHGAAVAARRVAVAVGGRVGAERLRGAARAAPPLGVVVPGGDGVRAAR